jgi:hypothetical protein
LRRDVQNLAAPVQFQHSPNGNRGAAHHLHSPAAPGCLYRGGTPSIIKSFAGCHAFAAPERGQHPGDSHRESMIPATRFNHPSAARGPLRSGHQLLLHRIEHSTKSTPWVSGPGPAARVEGDPCLHC